MFFVSEVTVPFNTLLDALKAFPAWKIIFLDGNDAFFQLPANQGQEDYVKYWEAVQLDPSQYKKPSTVAGLQELASGGQIIMHGLDGMVRGEYKNNPYSLPNVKPFGNTKPRYFNMEFTENSPLVPMFYSGFRKLVERGTYDKLSVFWQGAPVQYNGAVEIMVLSAGQVFLVFGVLMGMLSIALGFLALELAHFHAKKIEWTKNYV